MPCRILRCTCKHEFQDKKYGQGMRVYNQNAKTPGNHYRRTVCGKEQSK